MANYTVYVPGEPHTHSDGTFNYLTDVMVHSIRDELREHNHNVEVVFVEKTFPLGKLYACNVNFPELDLFLEMVPSSLWFILANDDTKKFVVFDLQDSPQVAHRVQNHKNLVFSLIGQFSLERYKMEYSGKLNLTKLVPFTYGPYYPNITKHQREIIQDIRSSTVKLDDRIFFYGNNRDQYAYSDPDTSSQKIREVISVLEDKYPDESCVGSWDSKLPLDEFFKKAATHTINLALPGHQWCSREHELWTLGLPVMMYEHTHHLCVNLIPNHHYVAVACGKRLGIGMARDPEAAADEIVKAHREWIQPENRWRLDLIAKNGQDRMDNYASPELAGKYTIPLLAIGHW